MIEAILSKLNAIPADKVAHFASGVIVFTVFNLVLSPLFGLLAVITAAVAKEVYDKLHKDTHTPDVWDAVATIAGGITCMLSAMR